MYLWVRVRSGRNEILCGAYADNFRRNPGRGNERKNKTFIKHEKLIISITLTFARAPSILISSISLRGFPFPFSFSHKKKRENSVKSTFKFLDLDIRSSAIVPEARGIPDPRPCSPAGHRRTEVLRLAHELTTCGRAGSRHEWISGAALSSKMFHRDIHYPSDKRSPIIFLKNQIPVESAEYFLIRERDY